MESFSLNVPFRLVTELKEDGEHYYTIGEISTNDKDYVNDIVTKNCLMSMANQINSGKIGLDFEHEAFKGDTEEERMIAKTKIPRAKFLPGKAEVNYLGKDEDGKDRWGLTTKSEINRNHPEYTSNLANIKEGYLHSYSIAYIPRRSLEKTIGDEAVRFLDDLWLLNTAYTGNPCNTKAQMRQVVTKSLTALDEYKKLKQKDPSIEDALEVKNREEKQDPMGHIWRKIYDGEVMDKKECKLLKAAMDLCGNEGTSAALAKEYFDKLSAGTKLNRKDYYIFRELVEMGPQNEEEPVMAVETETCKSHSTGKTQDDLTKLERKDNMTEENNEPAAPAAPASPEPAAPAAPASDPAAPAADAEGKALKVENAALKARLDKTEADIRALKEAPAANAEPAAVPAFKGHSMLALCR